MQVKIFNISLSADGAYPAEMNKFMAANKVLEVEQQLMADFPG